MILTPLPLLAALAFLVGRHEHPHGPGRRDAGAHLFRVAAASVPTLVERHCINLSG